MSMVADAANCETINEHDAVSDESLITFYRAYPNALPVMRAERSALGTIPTKAYQYCEALCSASAFGWYVFPPSDIRLYFDGSDVYSEINDDWVRLSSVHLPDVENWWDQQCPENLVGMAPPFLTNLGIPGYVQIWSGMLVKTMPEWSILVRPLVNVQTTNQYFCFEGIVETDRYCPAPLFTNIKLQTTGLIEIPADMPMFQVQPIPRESYSKNKLKSYEQHDIFDERDGDSSMSTDDWEGYRRTIRTVDPTQDDHSLGQYAVSSRRRGKKDH